MNKILIEVGSTVTKIDQYDGKKVVSLGNMTIWFKKHYKEQGRIDPSDVKKLVEKIQKLKKETNDIFVCGTSIFRDLSEEERNTFLSDFKQKTGIDFKIISSEQENELTVYGTTAKVNQKVAVFIGGGGSSEIAVYENGKILETANTPIGVVDIMNLYPDLAENFAITSIETVKKAVKEKLVLPKEKADILILAGGGHKFFALHSGISYETNTLYQDSLQPIMMRVENRQKDTEKYFKEISLDEIRKKVEDPNWWYATRAMCIFALVVAEEVGAKYIVPTDISMVYGIIKQMEKGEQE